jgi:hypothetical protein
MGKEIKGSGEGMTKKCPCIPQTQEEIPPVLDKIHRDFLRWIGMKIYRDAKFVDESEAKISVFDHGLLYGDGIFEGRPFLSRKRLSLRGAFGPFGVFRQSLASWVAVDS